MCVLAHMSGCFRELSSLAGSGQTYCALVTVCALQTLTASCTVHASLNNSLSFRGMQTKENGIPNLEHGFDVCPNTAATLLQ